MTFWRDFLDGIAPGLISGVAVWLFTGKALAPRLRLTTPLTLDSEGYHFKVINRPLLFVVPCKAVDVRVTAKLHVVGIDPKKPKWARNYAIPIVGGGLIPDIEHDRLLTLALGQIDFADRHRLLRALENEKNHSLLGVGSNAELRIAVSATNATNAARRIEQRYGAAEVPSGMLVASNLPSHRARGRGGLSNQKEFADQ